MNFFPFFFKCCGCFFAANERRLTGKNLVAKQKEERDRDRETDRETESHTLQHNTRERERGGGGREGGREREIFCSGFFFNVAQF